MLLRLIITGSLLIAASGAVSAQVHRYEAVRDAAKVPRQPWLRYHTLDSLGRTIDFYLSEAGRGDTLPLVVFVQGSSASSQFAQVGDRIVGNNGHSTINDVVRGKARLLIVEKPGISYLMTPGDSGIAAAAYADFRREHTLERWCEATHAAIEAARSLDEIRDDRLLIIGHSEGGLVASKLAADMDFVTHVAVLAGGGPSQLYDICRLAAQGTFFSHVSDDSTQRVKYMLGMWDQIQHDPDNPERLFFGHAFPRWSSFLKTSVMEQLGHCNARIFVAQGGRDEAVAPETAEMLYAQLLAAGKDVKYVYRADADHNFVNADGVDGWGPLHAEILEWFLD